MAFDWNRLEYNPLNAQFLVDLDVALLMEDADEIVALPAWRSAFVTIQEFRAHCDRHMVAHYADGKCRQCEEES